MAATQTWQIGDATGAAIAELTTASGRATVLTRNSFVEARATISHADEAAALLLSALANTGVPTLKIYRRADGASSATRAFAGYLAPFQEAAEEQATLSLVFRSPLGRLLGDGEARGHFTAASVPFVATDAGQIAKQLIDTANAESYTGLATTGAIAATKTRDRTYLYANVGEAVRNLTNVLDGFDMYEDFSVASGTTLAQLVIVAQQGQSVPNARFEYGPGTLSNVRSMTRTTEPPINRARVLGANGRVGDRSDAASILKYGLWMTQTSRSDVSEQATLDDIAAGLLRPNPVKTITFAPDFGLPGCPQFGDDFGLGDTVPFYALRDSLTESVQTRINAVTIPVSDDGVEAFQVADTHAARAAGIDPLHAAASDQFTTQAAVSVEVLS